MLGSILTVSLRSLPRPAIQTHFTRQLSIYCPAMNIAQAAANVPQLGSFRLPDIHNEPMLNYAPGSIERKELQTALADMRSQIATHGPFEIPVIVNDQEIKTNNLTAQSSPFEHKLKLCNFHNADVKTIDMAISKALKAKPAWEAMPFNDRAAIFLKAADLLSTKYRYKVMAATMIGQGKNAWQAEIDAAAELADFWRFNCKYAADIYADQPTKNSPLLWNRVEYRALEGFVVAYSPFNFTAIGGNLACAPALMGNVVLWKPSPMSMYSNYLIYEILREAGLPDGVIQFLPGDAELVTEQTFSHPEFAGFHFTGSTAVFKKLWCKIGQNLNLYKSYPRIVGETGGKNMHFLHESADVSNAALQTIRSAFEYNGQKCSACSRVYVPENIAEEFTTILKKEHAKLKMGPVDDFTNFTSAVINQQSYNKIKGYLDDVKNGKNPSTGILLGGKTSDETGYYIEPTVLITKDPKSSTMVNELFGPVVTVYVYPQDEYLETLELANSSSEYALTGALFAQNRTALIAGSNVLRNAAGNFYINDKSTGAVVGQQPFGGGRASGTNDKAGSALNLLRWVSPRTIKESFVPISSWSYPSNLPDN
ncbi:1-pyrroline-5-carboxylate dehydrogenase [Batrachochytrium dendrobatidis JEL423]|uniref:Multifunctional fusion protein n=1 Tax=Batrachochytrium dendrobatidis (strain JEL423) TaxID=403673 RepID=A0A177WIV2_BATDL|nr:1-pyrroline-5-carboxylate dehydrogenase [Batrachochytrium dendrobatidis JEL423]